MSTISVATIGFTRDDFIPTQFQYDPESPLEVRAVFHAEGDYDSPDAITWTFSRNLLFDGRTSATGSGDVTVWPSDSDDGMIMVKLESPDGTQTLKYSEEDVTGFVERIYDLVSEEDEETIIGDAFDAWIAGLSNDEA